ncbi:MAG: TMEM175 family protein [Burkholderiaceae bacterium]
MTGNESTVAHGPEHGLERLIFFSDAVFAIAITLLIIDIHVPHLPWGSPDGAYWAALLNLAPQFAGFFISFYVIGSFWAGHHREMALATHWSPSILLPNLMLLSTIAAIPFFTAFASANPAMRVPIFCYCLWLLVCAVANRRLQGIVTKPPIIGEHVTCAQVETVNQRGNAVILGTGFAALVSLVVPALGQLALTTIPLWRWLLRRHGDRRHRRFDEAT